MVNEPWGVKYRKQRQEENSSAQSGWNGLGSGAQSSAQGLPKQSELELVNSNIGRSEKGNI